MFKQNLPLHAPVSTGGKPRSQHMPALDGLRGWAVLAVMFYHFALPVLQQDIGGGRAWWMAMRLALTGSYGVDMFFVLSGFLITGILLDSKNDPRYFKTFYMRRVVRIFPLYYGVLAVCFGLLWWMPIMQPLVSKQAWLWLYVANFSELKHVSLEPMFSHFWSLAIEEQFYMVWPLVVLLLTKRSLLITSFVMAIVSPVLRCTLISANWMNAELAANLTFCRLDGLAMGALVATIARGPCGLERYKPAAIFMLVTGGIGTLLLKALYGSNTGSVWSISGVGHFTICAAVSGILILAVVGNGFWTRALSNPILRFFGKYSYGLYVFHYLLQPWMDSRFWYFTSLPTLSLCIHMLALTGISIAAAYASWHLFEKQFLKLKKYFEYTKSDKTPSLTTVHVLSHVSA